MFGRFALVITIAIGLCPLLSFGEKKVVILKNGRRIVGEVSKTKQGYEIRLKGGTVIIAADDVLKVTTFTDQKEELNRKLKEVRPDDPVGYYRVAYWAYNNGLLKEAREILTKKVLKLRPHYEDAELLLKLVELQIAKTAPSPTPSTRPTTVTRPGKRNLLSKEDIYHIRLVELKPTDKVVIRYRNKVLERFIKSMRGKGDFADPGFERTFRKWPKIKQVWYILSNTSRYNTAIRDDILIETDPQVIRVFRTRVWPIIAGTYASTSCYGGAKGKDGLKLFKGPPSDERITYTNFYILHKWQRNGLKFINRDDPDMSLLLQYGLPAKLAKVPKPSYIKGNIFTGPDDPRYKVIKNWIMSLRHPFLPPGYRVDYKLPGQSPTTKPILPTTNPSTIIPKSSG